jgi:transcriptional regulator EpsA
LAGGAFARELDRIGAMHLVAHGTHDSDGLTESFFTFACAPGSDVHRQAYLAQLLVPFLHTAWMRTQMNWRTRGNDAPKPARTSTITPREQEILRWIYLGKSNFEIGAILNISPLTVKNHVQKILRKLNVVNRAQAVGKALELRILNI